MFSPIIVILYLAVIYNINVHFIFIKENKNCVYRPLKELLPSGEALSCLG